ncbi:uncharacterized protein [Acropora muricata]|uniref:uncharacterized protein isoform X2 n=1 Tax=Acropora muricata TaxID=159855 RepID=UPI0034E4B33F
MANVISDDHVVLLEQTLHKNQQMIAENQKLREEMKAKEEEHSKVLREVLTELKNIRQKEDNVANRVRPQLQRRRNKIQVPSTCRRTLRKVFKTLATKDDFPGFYLTERVDSANNCHVLERVKLEIYHYVGGQDKCQWSDAQIEEAFKRYFLSTFETERKKEQGKYEEHKRLCRRQGRKRESAKRGIKKRNKNTERLKRPINLSFFLITNIPMASIWVTNILSVLGHYTVIMIPLTKWYCWCVAAAEHQPI